MRAVTEIEAKIRGIKRHPVIRKTSDRVADRLTEAGKPVPAALLDPDTVTNAVAAAGADSTDVITTSEVGDSVETSPTPETVSTLVYSTQSGKASPAHETPATLDELMIETREKVRRTFSGFLGPVVEAGVPFAATYGNHDFQCGILADEQDDIYREYPGCLNPDDSLEPGTFALPVESSDGSGRVAMSVMMVNSGDYAGKPEENDAQYPAYVVNPRGLDLADADGYGTPTPKAIEWLGSVQTELGERNGDGKPVPAIAFQHIPPQEFYDCLKEVPAWTPNAVEGARTHAGRCYVLNHESAAPARGSARRSAARTRMWARWMPCARLAAISRCSAGMTIRTLSLVMCMISIWAMHPRAGSNAMVPSRGTAAFACLNSMRAIRRAM